MVLQPQPDMATQGAALAAMGLRLEGPAPSADLELLPCVLPAVRVFAACMTQWRMGPAGPVGLDYLAVQMVMRRVHRVPPEQFADTFADVQTLEDEALRWFDEQTPEPTH